MIYILRIPLLIILFIISNNNIQIHANPLIEKLPILNNTEEYNEVYSIVLMKDNTLFLATDNGLFIYDGHYIKKYNDKYIGKEKTFIGFFKSKHNSILAFPLNHQLIKINEMMNATTIIEYNARYYFAYTNKNDIIIYSIGNNLDCFEINISQDYKFNYKKKLAISNDFFISYLNNKINNQDTLLKYNKIIQQTSINDLAVLQDSLLILKNKLFLVQDKELKFLLDISNHQIEGQIFNLYYDKDKLYFCIRGKDLGLYLHENKKIHVIYNEDLVTGVAKDGNNNIYFSTLHNGLFSIKNSIQNSKKVSFKDFKVNLAQMNSLDEDIFIASDFNNNLYKYYYKTNTLQKIYKFKKPISRKGYLYKNESGICEYLVSNEYFILNKDKTKKQLSYNVQDIMFIKHFKLSQDYFWGKKYCVINNVLTQLKFNVNDVILFNDSTFLCASDKGLYKIKSNNFQNYSKLISNSDLDQSKITNITISKQYIYFLCDKGVFSLNTFTNQFEEIPFPKNSIPKQLFCDNTTLIGIYNNSYYAYEENSKSIKSFQFGNITNNETLLGGFYTNQYYIFYSNFTVYFCDKQSLKHPTVNITPYFATYSKDSISINNSTPSYNFKWKKNSYLSIFLNVNFYQPTLHSSIKCLVINEQDTIEKKELLYPYSFSVYNLDPGTYDLYFSYENYVIKNTFTIKPRWFQYTISYIILGILFSGIIIISAYIYFRRIQKQNYYRISQNVKILELEGSSRLNQLNPHFIFNALIPLQNYILRNEKGLANNYLNQLSSLLRSMLNISREKYLSIHQEIEFLEKYLKLQQIEKNNTFNFSINNSLNFETTHSRFIPTLLIQPIIENAIMHGIKTEKMLQGKIQIEFNYFNTNYISVSIIDNGDGFNLEEILNKRSNNAIHIINERLVLLKSFNNYPETKIYSNKTENNFEIKLILPLLKNEDDI